MVNLLPEDQRKNNSRPAGRAQDVRPEFTMHRPAVSEGADASQRSSTRRLSLSPSPGASSSSSSSRQPSGGSLAQNTSEKNKFVSGGNPFLNSTHVTKGRPSTDAGIRITTPIPEKSEHASGESHRRASIPVPQMPLRRAKNRISVNLVPEDTLRVVKEELPERLKYLALFVVILCALSFAGWGLLSWLHIGAFTEVQNVRNEISQRESKIHQYKTQSSEVIKLSERYDTVVSLLDDHVYWTKFFTLLEKYTLPDVYYTSFSVKSDKGSRITLNARARNIEVVAQQLRRLQEASDFVEDVHINGFSMLSNVEKRGVDALQGDDIVAFDVTMTLTDDVFLILAP